MNRRSFFRFLAGAPIAASVEITTERYGFADVTDCVVTGYVERYNVRYRIPVLFPGEKISTT